MIGLWTPQAEAFAEDIREPGFAAAGCNARAWRARVVPEASRGFVAAAIALTDGDAKAALWGRPEPFPDDKAMLTAAEELEAAIGELLAQARRMIRACTADLEAAQEALAAAMDELATAQAQLAQAANEQAAAAAELAIEAAMEKIAEAERRIADCEVALEILGAAEQKLAYALNCVRQIPDDLAATYEAPYALVRDGGVLPWSGDFLTGRQRHDAA